MTNSDVICYKLLQRPSLIFRFVYILFCFGGNQGSLLAGETTFPQTPSLRSLRSRTQFYVINTNLYIWM